MQSDCDRPAWIDAVSGSARGEGGSFPSYGWTSKNCVICVCFHCHGTSSYHTTNTLQGRRAKSHVDTQTIQPRLGDFVLQTPYRPIPHLPPCYKILAAPPDAAYIAHGAITFLDLFALQLKCSAIYARSRNRRAHTTVR